MPSIKDQQVTKAQQAMQASRAMSDADDAKGKGKKNPLETKQEKELLSQLKSEYKISEDFMRPKWKEWAVRLKIYNNQKRNKEDIGDPLLFTVMQTVIASLYEDRMLITFEGREQGDINVAENITNVADYDYSAMGKDETDYSWIWDTGFFGRGLLCVAEFDRDQMMPLPEVWDPMTVLRDPKATSVNGDVRGRGAARWIGRQVRLSMYDMKKDGIYFNLDKLEGKSEDSIDQTNPVDFAKETRNTARGYTNQVNKETLKGENRTHVFVEWFTRFDGKLVLVTSDSEFKHIFRYTEVPYNYIPIIDRVLFATSHDWDNVSIPDIVEDKQRARAVLANLSLRAAKANVHPRYLYNKNKIRNKGDLAVKLNKHIGVDGDPNNALIPVQKDGVRSEVSYIMDLLDQSAQRATATPELQQGITASESRTATELNLVSKGVGTRFSLASRIFGWSEKRFWRHWYLMYKEYLDAKTDEKVVRISGALGATWRKFAKNDLVATVDPDVRVKSRAVSEAEKFNELGLFKTWLDMISQDPNANVRSALRYMGKLTGHKHDQIEIFYPDNIEEMRAKEENDKLSDDKPVIVSPTDDHIAHIEIHNRLPDTAAKFAHIRAHKRAMLLQRQAPELFEGSPQSGVNPTGGHGFKQTEAVRPVPTKNNELPSNSNASPTGEPTQ